MIGKRNRAKDLSIAGRVRAGAAEALIFMVNSIAHLGIIVQQFIAGGRWAAHLNIAIELAAGRRQNSQARTPTLHSEAIRDDGNLQGWTR
jgi:hypothetical protein